MIIVAVDAHKRTRTCVAVDRRGAGNRREDKADKADKADEADRYNQLDAT